MRGGSLSWTDWIEMSTNTCIDKKEKCFGVHAGLFRRDWLPALVFAVAVAIPISAEASEASLLNERLEVGDSFSVSRFIRPSEVVLKINPEREVRFERAQFFGESASEPNSGGARSLSLSESQHVLELVGSKSPGEIVGQPRTEQGAKDCSVDFVRQRDHGVLRLIAGFVFGVIGAGELSMWLQRRKKPNV